jgi:hypothetical protein
VGCSPCPEFTVCEQGAFPVREVCRGDLGFMASGMRPWRPRRYVSGMGDMGLIFDALLAPISAMVTSGLNVWGAVEQQNLVKDQAVAQAAAAENQIRLAAAQAAAQAATQASAQAQTRQTITTATEALLALGVLAIGGLVLLRATRKRE